MVYVSNEMLATRRRVVRRPVLRHKLMSLLHEYNVTIHDGDEDDDMFSFSHDDSRVHVVGESDVTSFFASDVNSLNAFRRIGGVLLRTSLCMKFSNRHFILCDIKFWHLWDVIAIKSGWSLLDVERFNEIFNSDECGYLGLVRSSHFPTSGDCELSNMVIDSVCDVNAAYGAFSDICKVLQTLSLQAIRNNALNHALSIVFISIADDRDRALLNKDFRTYEYQFCLVRRMIACRLPIELILRHCLELNATTVSLMSMIGPDFDTHNVSHFFSIFVQELNVFVHFSDHAHMVSRLRSFCNVDFL